LYALTRALSNDPDAPAEVRALGGVLNRVLSGEHDPDLSALPPGLAQAVRRMVSGLS
jgi:hypothetical protein